MIVQVGNKVYGGEGKPIILYLSKDDKKFISEMGENAYYYIISDKGVDEINEWLGRNTMIPRDRLFHLKQSNK